tara:strand:+ start:1149 stop:1877 length:729 start_codon:yes stop_codon:yes gene_type:complete
MNSKSEYLAIILAAGKGSRLNTEDPKPLYKLNGLPMIDSIIESISNAQNIDILTVVGHQKTKVVEHISNRSKYAIQENTMGTGHALMQCLDFIKEYSSIFVFVGDAPLITFSLINELRDIHIKSNADCSFLYSEFPFKLPYARLIFNEDKSLRYLIESNQASIDELKVKTMFTSHYLFKTNILQEKINDLLIDEESNEYNLTDLINIYLKQGLKVSPLFTADFWKLMGVNTVEDAMFLEGYQ